MQEVKLLGFCLVFCGVLEFLVCGCVLFGFEALEGV